MSNKEPNKGIREPIHGSPLEPDAITGPDGAFRVGDSGHYLYCICPCGCKQYRSIPLSPAQARGWTWNGNRDYPTLSPSIRDVGVCFYHGYLLDGVWTFLEDSGRK